MPDGAVSVMIDLYVISLPGSERRRANAAGRLGSLNIPFEFYDAVSGDAGLCDGSLGGVDREQWLIRCGREVTTGELGCFASHRNLWRRCVELDRPIMILEDDFRLLDGFSDAVKAVEDEIDRLGYIRLQSETRARYVSAGRVRGFEIRRYTYAPHSAMCYAIAPRVARAFVEQTRIAEEPVDVFVKQFWRHGQVIYGLAPYTVTESALSEDTKIPGRVKARKPLPVRLRRLGTKVAWHAQRLRFNRLVTERPLAKG